MRTIINEAGRMAKRQIIKLDKQCEIPEIIRRSLAGPTILKEEVEAVMKNMNNEKATESKEIITENLRIETTTKPLNPIYDNGATPADLCKCFDTTAQSTRRNRMNFIQQSV
ncbi:hypothetical protein PoB_002104500 [Plakobranchus ocellatus]|uniref:Uncharacterized protein n=1 Tax=Plakobranchus ocellatus TaxID=259542 RepID=A0AAV3ZJ02_9GAST|nr:hypothetical protein PoB_002104500 [Plakobranchus ocellatus]